MTFLNFNKMTSKKENCRENSLYLKTRPSNCFFKFQISKIKYLVKSTLNISGISQGNKYSSINLI